MLDGRWRGKVEEGLEPVGKGLHSIGVTADALTIFGLCAAVVTAALIANGNLLLAVFGLILTGLPDILDGSVARQSAPRATGARSSTPSATGSPTGSSSSASRGTSPPRVRTSPCSRWPCSHSRCSSPTSEPGPSRSATRRGAG